MFLRRKFAGTGDSSAGATPADTNSLSENENKKYYGAVSTSDDSAEHVEDLTLIGNCGLNDRSNKVRDHGNDRSTVDLEGVPRRVYVLVLCAALNSGNLGFDIGVNTTTGIMVQKSMHLSDLKLELFMGSINFFALFGAMISSRVTANYGLRGSFVVASIGFIIGILIMTLSNSFTYLMLGRVFVGVGVGFGMTIGPMYISEVSPKTHRGALGSWSEIGTNVGILVGFLTGVVYYPFPPDPAWRYMFATGMIMPFLMIILTLKVMTESPRWLAQKDRDQEALEVLCQIHPQGYNVQAELKEIKDAIAEERELTERTGWDAIICPSPTVRRMLIVGIGTAISHQSSGIDAIQYYMNFILKEAGIEERLHRAAFLTGLGVLKLGCLFIAAPLFDKFGRRPLLFVSLSGAIIALLSISAEFYVPQSHPGIVIAGLSVYLAFFSLGLGPLGWLIPSEIFSPMIRAKALSTTTFINRLTGTAVASSMLSLASWLSWGGYFLFLAAICTVILLFFYTFLPETKDKSLEEVAHHFSVKAAGSPTC